MADEADYQRKERKRRLLDLSNSGLTHLDPSSALIRNKMEAAFVRRLVLTDNELSHVPSSISQFVNLEELDVSRNRISWLNGEIAHLPKLRLLIARNNNLRHLPKEFESLLSLHILNLSGNLYDDLPREVFGLRNLKELYFGGNNISNIPQDIRRLQSLQVLYFGGNKLRDVPESLGSLESLQALILCDNQLTQIPRELARLKSLKSLSLHKNRLQTLPMEIVMLVNLQELSLRDNPLVNKFARAFDFNPPSLLELSGRAVKITQVPYSPSTLPAPLVSYLDSARSCVNPKCKGVYFDSRVRCLKFVDFCGQYRLPLEQYLCSPHFNCELEHDNSSVSALKIQKLLLPRS